MEIEEGTDVVMLIERGCGYRIVGGTYATWSAQVEPFMVCPPYPIDKGIFCNDGIRILERVNFDGSGTGIFDVYDIVGRTNYDLASFVEEGIRYGFSRKVGVGPQLAQITKESWYFYLIDDAVINNWKKVASKRVGIRSCPVNIGPHNAYDKELTTEGCLALHWEVMPEHTGNATFVPEDKGRLGYYHFAGIAYKSARAPSNWKMDGSLGIFMKLPCEDMRWEVIEDPLGAAHQHAMELLDKLGGDIPYQLVKE